MSAVEELRDFLWSFKAFSQPTLPGWLADRATFWSPGVGYAETGPWRDAGCRLPQSCYANASRLAELNGLRFATGYAFQRLLPLTHAWCVDEHDRVIDPTPNWDSAITVYAGVILDETWLRRHYLEVEIYGLELEAYASEQLKKEKRDDVQA